MLTTNATGRIEAFSDGVFAIAITLLVLDLKVPRGAEGERARTQALLGQWPSYISDVARRRLRQRTASLVLNLALAVFSARPVRASSS